MRLLKNILYSFAAVVATMLFFGLCLGAVLIIIDAITALGFIFGPLLVIMLVSIISGISITYSPERR